jgi:hypothetical protein
VETPGAERRLSAGDARSVPDDNRKGAGAGAAWMGLARLRRRRAG